MKNMGYSIKDLEVLSGIKAHTIRIWEKRYNLLTPERTKTNIRFYNDDDLRRMLNVSLLVRYGYKISRVAKWSDDAINDAVLEVTETKTSESDYINRLILYMVNFDNVKFNNLVDEIISKKGIEEATSGIFFEFFIKVGIYWQVGSIFPAQEHSVTHLFRQKIIAETEKLGATDQQNPTILFFLPENELHELSLLFYNYLAIKLNYHTIYLGQSVPWDDLVKISRQVKVDFVFTAFINSLPKEDLANYLNSLKELFSNQRIFITGWQVQVHQPEIPRNVKIIKNYKAFIKYMKKTGESF